MRTESNPIPNAFSHLLLPGTILLANVDPTGLFAYGLRALIGGAIWLGYKCAYDYIDNRRNKKANNGGAH